MKRLSKTEYLGTMAVPMKQLASDAQPNGNCQHVLVNSEDKNVFMVLVLDLASRSVLGHRLLNLNQEYGLESA